MGIETEMELEMVFLTLTDCGLLVMKSSSQLRYRDADTQWTQLAYELLGYDRVKG